MAACEGIARILRMIVRQDSPAVVLDALCQHAAEDAGEHLIFFLVDGERWTVIAKGRLVPEAALAAIDPATLSQALFDAGGSEAGEGALCALDGGWARYLCSGAGELLGMAVGVASAPYPPQGPRAGLIETACHLATLAIEQGNLLAELTFQNSLDAISRLGQRSNYREQSMHRITQMIARQCGVSEILNALCRHAGEGSEDQQLAFFLTDGERWTAAAKGELTQRSESALARFDPARLSEQLLQRDACAADHPAFPFDGGWACHLYSGAGELLGMLVGLEEIPALAHGLAAMDIESICRLATLALEQHNLVEELAFQAEHDPLTGLYNRLHYERALGWMLQEGRRKGRRPALLYINLDRFRMVNDVLGHATGDRLLRQIGRRFESALRAGDLLARVGGDEFAILIADAQEMEDAGAVGGRLLSSLKEPFSTDGHQLFIGAGIGISWASRASTLESLEREAYLALRHAKLGGASRLAYFHSSMAATPPERLEIEKRLHFALPQKEMLVYYQPQVDTLTGRVTGAEALMRWRPAGLGVVSPSAFVPILEETGLIGEFGRWILAEACRQGREWMDQTGLRLRMGVNVAAAQLALPGFVQDVQQALMETGFPPELLELELTESAFVGDFAAAARTFRNLQSSAGVTFALDDFGTGQSSLSYLHRLPFQRLKIDQSFIRRIMDGQEPEPLLESILRMAQGLGMSAIAEGVETPHQLQVLRSLRCPEAQGYLFAQPMTAGEFREYCDASPSADGALQVCSQEGHF